MADVIATRAKNEWHQPQANLPSPADSLVDFLCKWSPFADAESTTMAIYGVAGIAGMANFCVFSDGASLMV